MEHFKFRTKEVYYKENYKKEKRKQEKIKQNLTIDFLVNENGKSKKSIL